MSERWAKRGNASLGVFINNGEEKKVCGVGLTTEEAVEAVCSYLPVAPTTERDRLRAQLEIATAALREIAGYQFSTGSDLLVARRALHVIEQEPS